MITLSVFLGTLIWLVLHVIAIEFLFGQIIFDVACCVAYLTVMILYFVQSPGPEAHDTVTWITPAIIVIITGILYGFSIKVSYTIFRN